MSTSIARVQTGYHVPAPLLSQHEPASRANSSSLLLRSHGSLTLGTTLNANLQRLGAVFERHASRFIHSRGFGPEASSEAIEAIFGDDHDWQQELKVVLATDVDRDLRKWAQDLLESRSRTRGVHLDNLHNGALKNMKSLDNKCKSLISSARSDVNQTNQLSAIKQILFLTTRYPGLRKIFVKHLKVKDDSSSTNKVILLWKSRTNTDPKVNQDEWLFYLHKSVHSLLPPEGYCTYLSAIEQALPSKLGFVDLAHCQQRTVIEQLISVCEDAHDLDDRCIAIRYLAGILDLYPFWLSACLRTNHTIVRRLLGCAVKILEDEGIADCILESSESAPSQHATDRDGIDFLMIAILFGTLAWNPERDDTGDYRFIWLDEHNRLITFIRRAQAADIAPRAHSLVLYCDKEGFDWPFHRLTPTMIVANMEVPMMDNHNVAIRMCPSRSRGKNVALLMASTYQHVHTNGSTMLPLKYSHKDPVNLKNLLLEHGYKEEDITILVDVGDNKETYPTRVNIIKHMKELVYGAKAGDSFFVHFSGYVDQLVAAKDEFEADGMDEFIYPCDYHELQQEGKEHYIMDSFMRENLVDSLPEGCKLIGLFDCRSSGTVLDLPIYDNSEGDRVSVVSVTEAEEILIGKSLTWKTTESGGRILQLDEPSGLTVISADAGEPAEDCSASFDPVDKLLPAGARPGMKSLSLQPDASTSAQGQEGEHLTSVRPSIVKPFSTVVEARRTENQSSQTLPNDSRRFQNRESGCLPELANLRGMGFISDEANILDATAPVDTRVINADVLCIASYSNNNRTYETSGGGVLVQAFCAVVGSTRRDGRVLTLGGLKSALRQQLQKVQNIAVENIVKEDRNIKMEEYDTLIPEFSYSHEYDKRSTFTIC